MHLNEMVMWSVEMLGLFGEAYTYSFLLVEILVILWRLRVKQIEKGIYSYYNAAFISMSLHSVQYALVRVFF